MLYFSPFYGIDLVISAGGFHSNSDQNYVQVYNVQEDTWTLKNPFPFSFRFGQAFVLDSKRFHVTGGFTDPEGFKIREYDLENDAWIEGFEFSAGKKNGIGILYNIDWWGIFLVYIIPAIYSRISALIFLIPEYVLELQ